METLNNIKSIVKEEINKKNRFSQTEDVVEKIIKILKIFSINPWATQEEIFSELKIKNKEELINLNEIIRNSNELQEYITNKSPSKKYWKTILPFSSNIEDVLEKKAKLPLRIALFPGVSCMFFCGFCGRNQKAKYQSSVIKDGIENICNLIKELDLTTKISISGGLEPLTNPLLSRIIDTADEKKFKIPLITNGYSLTKNYVEKNPSIWKLDSLRISLYGYDEKSYRFITTLDKSYKIVKKNLIDFLKLRNENNYKTKIGLNYIILPENMNNLIEVLEFIVEVNKAAGGKGIDFLTLRDDYQSVTGHNNSYDNDRKYFLEKSMRAEERKKMIKILENFKIFKSKNCPDLHIDFGYSLEFLSNGYWNKGLIKVSGDKIAKFGYPQLSVAIDLHGDVFLFREAGFLDREGNKKVIIGRITKKLNLYGVIKEFLKKDQPINFENEDSRFLDSFDHVLNALIDQANKDARFGIPFKLGPIQKRLFSKTKSLGNNWYSDDI